MNFPLKPPFIMDFLITKGQYSLHIQWFHLWIGIFDIHPKNFHKNQFQVEFHPVWFQKNPVLLLFFHEDPNITWEPPTSRQLPPPQAPRFSRHAAAAAASGNFTANTSLCKREGKGYVREYPHQNNGLLWDSTYSSSILTNSEMSIDLWDGFFGG